MNNSIIGIDVGSISISVVEMDMNKTVKNSVYLFHNGDIKENLTKILKEFDLKRVAGIAATSNTKTLLKNAEIYDSVICYIKTAKRYYQKVGSILIVGGEKFGLALFDRDGEYLNYRSNTSCAAGTGSFLDQQARRLNLKNIEEFSSLSLSNKNDIPKIASRCSVFAKTDLIHAQQEGYSLEEICDGLSYGLAKNIVDTLFNNNLPRQPLIFAGGVSKNRAVVKHISNMLNMDIIVSENSHIFGAIGAAINLIDDEKYNTGLALSDVSDILIDVNQEKKYSFRPLKLELSDYPEFDSIEKYEFNSKRFNLLTPVEVDIYESLTKDKNIDVYLGIDIGSTSTKAVLVDREKKVLAGFYTRTSGRPIQAVQCILESIGDIEKNKTVSFSFSGVGTTGSGRKFAGEIIGADSVIDEITAHARAAYELDPEVDTIIEIGGQDSKFTTLKNGMVTFSVMNNVCAAGTGSFIEEQAKKLGCGLSEYSNKAEGIPSPLASDRCTVFMERDLNYYLSDGYSVNEILATVLHSVRDNYLSKVAIENNIGNKIFFQGATAKNKALVAAFEQKLGKPVMVSKYCHLTGALGVALILHDENAVKSSFKGIDIYKNDIHVKSEVCDICANHCKIKTANVNGEVVAFGFLCGRDYETGKYKSKKKGRYNLLGARKKAFGFNKTGEYINDITIGLPASLYMFEDMPFWERFFDYLSIKTVTSKSCSDSIKEGKKLSRAEFCAPVTSLHGHVNYLIDKCDYVFLPVYLEMKNDFRESRSQYCYYTQFAPPVISSNEKIGWSSKILSPLVRTRKGEFFTKYQLYNMLTEKTGLAVNFFQVSSAYDKAARFYNSSLESLKKKFISEKESANDISVVFLGRPYTILNEDMNNNIPELFENFGVKTFFQDMLSYDKKEVALSKKILDAFHWKFAKKIIEAAEITAKTGGLYPVLVTSFKCSPDSFVLEYFKTIMDKYDKPYLILQLDEHSSNVGYETRIEAGIRSFRNHYSRNTGAAHVKRFDAGTDILKGAENLKNKTILLPQWDAMTCRLLAAVLKQQGFDARVLEENEDIILRSTGFNTGQCIPLTAIFQGALDYIKKYNLNPENVIVWTIKSSISCNIRMFPYYMKNLFESYGKGFEKVSVYTGEITFSDNSFRAALNTYFAYMFSGFIKKLGCKIRPYETVKGITDKTIETSIAILENTFLNNSSKEEALTEIVGLFEKIKTSGSGRPKAAIFGDMYVRDNDVMNRNLIKTIEENGGEVVTTPFNEYLKIIAEPYIRKWMKEGHYAFVAKAKIIQKTVEMLERKYFDIFNSLLKEPFEKIIPKPEETLANLDVKLDHTGESLENILKIFYLTENYPDISLFVQTNPSYCCPSLVTEAMVEKIEKLTGIPIVTIEYDGTGGPKNDDIIPYLKYPRKKKGIVKEEAV